MRYRELVARITEVTRTLVSHGGYGKFEQDFTFNTGAPFPANLPDGLTLEIAEGAAKGEYPVSEVDPERNTLVLAQGPSIQGAHLKWKLYSPGVPEKDIRRVLLAFPQVIMECKEGEQVRTDLGTFRMTRRKRRRVKIQGRWGISEERLIARIRPGKRLQREVEEVSELPGSKAESQEEDPPT